MTRRHHKLIIGLISCIPVIVMLILGGLYLSRQLTGALEHANSVIIDEFTRRLGKEVSIGKSSVTPFGTAVLDDVRVAQGERLADGEMIRARQILIRYNIKDLLYGAKGAQSIRSVTVRHPNVNLIRRKDGTLNVQDLLKPPPGRPGPPFLGTVEVTDADVVFTDFRSHHKMLPSVTRFKSLDAYLDASDQPIYKFNATAANGGSELREAKVVGRYDARSKSARLDLYAEDALAPYWAEYLGLSSRSVKPLSGRLKVVMGLEFRKSASGVRTYYSGTVGVTGAALVIPGFKVPAGQIFGNAIVNNQRALISMTGLIGDSPVKVTGIISDYANTRLNLTATASNVDYTDFLRSVNISESARELKPSGRGPLIAKISGRASTPSIDVTGTVPRVLARGYTARNVVVSALYEVGYIQIRSLSFLSSGARFFASGSLSVEKAPKIAAEGRVDNLSLSNLSATKEMGVKGSVRAAFRLSGSLASPDISVSAVVANGSVRGVPFDSISGRAAYSEKVLRVNDVRISGPSIGVVALGGILSEKKIALDVVAEGTDLSKLAKLMGVKGLQGIVYFRGRVLGSASKPRVSGLAELFQGSYNGVEIDYARASFAGDSRGVRISQAIVRLFPSEVHFSGQVGHLKSSRVPFQLSGDFDSLTVNKLASLAGRKIDATGAVSGEFESSGIYSKESPKGSSPFVDVKANASVRIENGSIADLPISSAQARLTLEHDRLQIADAELVSQGGKLTASGFTELASKTVDVDFLLKDFDFARVRDRIRKYALVDGIAQVKGKLTGTWNVLNATANASIKDLSINGSRFDSATFSVASSGNVISTFKVQLAQGEQLYSAEATDFDLDSRSVKSALLTLTHVSASSLWQILASSSYLQSPQAANLRDKIRSVPRITGGIIDANLAIDGAIDSPNGQLKLHVSNMGIDIRNIESVDVDATSVNGLITLNHLEALSEETNVQATGSFALSDRQLKLDVVASNFDLSRLRPWLKDNTPSGIARADFIVDGVITHPHVLGSIEVVKPGFGSVTFDALRASRIEILDNKIQLSDIILAKSGHQAVARGHIPWSWSDMAIPADQPLEFTASIEKQSLDLVAAFTSLADTANTSGEVEATVSVNGTLSKPRMSGSLIVSNGKLALKNFTNTFDNLNVEVVFSGDRIVVNRMSVDSSLGGNMRVNPGAYATLGSNLTASLVEIVLVSDGFVLGEKNALGYKEDISMRIDGAISARGSLANPRIADETVGNIIGGIKLSSARLAFVAPEGPAPRLETQFAVNPQFNVSVVVGDDVWITPPGMAMRVSGNGSIKGSLSKPVASLKLNIDEGSIRLAGSRMRVFPGGEITASYAPPAQPDVRVAFKATTSVSATSLLGRRQRYQITMTVRGPVSNLQVEMASSPGGLSREQMLASLGRVEGLFAANQTDIQKELGNILTAVGSSRIFAPVESIFVERLGFEQFSLQYSGNQPLALYVSRKLVNNFYLSYYSRLTSQYANTNDVNFELSLGYRLTDKYMFSLGVDDQEVATLTTEYTSSF